MPFMSARKYTLKELESRTGFGSRTIRNYIDKGLLPGAYSRGRYASYGQEHLDRLLFLRKLKNRGKLPLDEVRRLLLQLAPERIKAIAHGHEDMASIATKPHWDSSDHQYSIDEYAPTSDESMDLDSMKPDSSPGRSYSAPPPADSALDYIRRLRSPGSPERPGRSDSRLRQAAHQLQRITPGHHPPARRAKGEWWAAIEVTPDIELRARGLDGDDLAALESIADAFRALLSRDF